MKKSFDEDHLETKAEYLHALANPVRLKILALIESKEMCVNDLAKAMKTKQPNISQHLNILKNCGIIKKKRDGKSINYFLNVSKVTDILNSVDTLIKK